MNLDMEFVWVICVIALAPSVMAIKTNIPCHQPDGAIFAKTFTLNSFEVDYCYRGFIYKETLTNWSRKCLIIPYDDVQKDKQYENINNGECVGENGEIKSPNQGISIGRLKDLNETYSFEYCGKVGVDKCCNPTKPVFGGWFCLVYITKSVGRRRDISENTKIVSYGKNALSRKRKYHSEINKIDILSLIGPVIVCFFKPCGSMQFF